MSLNLFLVSICQRTTGEDKVAKFPLTLDDLDEDDLEALAGGSFQLLPGKDMAGRGVGFIARKFATFKHWKAGVRGIIPDDYVYSVFEPHS